MRSVIALFTSLVLIALSHSIFASNNSYPYLGLTGGLGFSKIGQNNTELVGGTKPREYRSTSDYDATPVFGVNGGYEFTLQNNLVWSIGLGLYQTLSYESDGEIWDTTITTEHTLDYTYKVSSTRLMLESEIGMQCNNNFMPFVTIGIGPSWNHAESYQEKSINSGSDPEAPFLDHTSAAFAYQIGAGIAYSLTAKDRFSLAYRFVDLGSLHFGNKDNAAHSVSPYMLPVGRVKTHEVIFNYTYLFE